MKNSNGFTLVEVIIVLSILSIFILIGSSVKISLIDNYRTEHFLDVFHNDILYMQQKTVVTKENFYMYINPNEHNYEIKKGYSGTAIVKRNIPKHWDVKLNTLRMPISFSENGTIKDPGTFSITTTNKSYAIYFPFGVGRSYSIETG